MTFNIGLKAELKHTERLDEAKRAEIDHKAQAEAKIQAQAKAKAQAKAQVQAQAQAQAKLTQSLIDKQNMNRNPAPGKALTTVYAQGSSIYINPQTGVKRGQTKADPKNGVHKGPEKAQPKAQNNAQKSNNKGCFPCCGSTPTLE